VIFSAVLKQYKTIQNSTAEKNHRKFTCPREKFTGKIHQTNSLKIHLPRGKIHQKKSLAMGRNFENSPATQKSGVR